MKYSIGIVAVIIIGSALFSLTAYSKEKKVANSLRTNVVKLTAENNELVKASKKTVPPPLELIAAGTTFDNKTSSLSCRERGLGSECSISLREQGSTSTITHSFVTEYAFLPIPTDVKHSLLFVGDSYALITSEVNAKDASIFYGTIVYKDGIIKGYDAVLGKTSATSSIDIVVAKKKDDTSIELYRVGQSGNVATSTVLSLSKKDSSAGYTLGADCDLVKKGISCIPGQLFAKKENEKLFVQAEGKVTIIAHNTKTKIGMKDFTLDYQEFLLR